MTTYRQRWKYRYTATPASIAHHASETVVLVHTNPKLTTRMHSAACDIRFAKDEAALTAAIEVMAGLVREAHDAGLMIDVTTNRDKLRRNSWKHCITLHVHAPDEPAEQWRRVFINQMSRNEHDAIMPAIRQMFVSGEAQA